MPDNTCPALAWMFERWKIIVQSSAPDHENYNDHQKRCYLQNDLRFHRNLTFLQNIHEWMSYCKKIIFLVKSVD
jgi:hypothetical protein